MFNDNKQIGHAAHPHNLEKYRGDSGYLQNLEQLRVATAYHEAGHAIAGRYFGKHICEKGIFVDWDNPGEGLTHTRGEIIFPQGTPNFCEPRVKTECIEYLAGYVAEFKAMRVRSRFPKSEDLRRVKEIIRNAYEFNEFKTDVLVHIFLQSTRRLLARKPVWESVTRLTNALLNNEGVLSPDEANKLICNLPVRPVHHNY